MSDSPKFEPEHVAPLPRFPGIQGANKGEGTSSSFAAPAGGSVQRGRPSRSDRIALGQEEGPKPSKNWSVYSVAELSRMRDEITKELPSLELSNMNLEEEMLLQYHTLRELQGLVMDDVDVPVNQRAQVANSVASTLKSLGDMQIALYSAERFKQVENALIRNLDKLPEEVAAEFLDVYAKILKKYAK